MGSTDSNKQVNNKKGVKIGCLVLVLISFLILIFAIFSDGDNSKKEEASSGSDKSETTQQSEIVQNWKYQDEEDKMTGTIHHLATCESTNILNFKFPYEGGSTCKLIIQKVGDDSAVLLYVSKGQFSPSILSDEYCRVKFDEDKTVNYTYNDPSNDASVEYIIFDNPIRFINKLKNTKKLLIEAPFFQEGRQIIEFNTEGLNW